MIRRPPRSTLFPLHDALPISAAINEIRAAYLAVKSETGSQTTLDAALQRYNIEMEGDSVVIPNVAPDEDRKSTRLNSSHANISYAVFCLKKKKKKHHVRCENI